jgi:hypothetical protein
MTALLYIHRTYLVEALSRWPEDPVRSRFGLSVLAVHRSSLIILQGFHRIREHFLSAFPQVLGLWLHVSPFYLRWRYADQPCVKVCICLCRFHRFPAAESHSPYCLRFVYVRLSFVVQAALWRARPWWRLKMQEGNLMRPFWRHYHRSLNPSNMRRCDHRSPDFSRPEIMSSILLTRCTNKPQLRTKHSTLENGRWKHKAKIPSR